MNSLRLFIVVSICSLTLSAAAEPPSLPPASGAKALELKTQVQGMGVVRKDAGKGIADPATAPPSVTDPKTNSPRSFDPLGAGAARPNTSPVGKPVVTERSALGDSHVVPSVAKRLQPPKPELGEEHLAAAEMLHDQLPLIRKVEVVSVEASQARLKVETKESATVKVRLFAEGSPNCNESIEPDGAWISFGRREHDLTVPGLQSNTQYRVAVCAVAPDKERDQRTFRLAETKSRSLTVHLSDLKVLGDGDDLNAGDWEVSVELRAGRKTLGMAEDCFMHQVNTGQSYPLHCTISLHRPPPRIVTVRVHASDRDGEHQDYAWGDITVQTVPDSPTAGDEFTRPLWIPSIETLLNDRVRFEVRGEARIRLTGG